MKSPEQLLDGQQEKEKVTDQALASSLLVSVIGILFCMACLFGLTWAWFSNSVNMSSNKITAATFDLNITVTEQETTNAITVNENGDYILEPEKKYTVKLAKRGTAKTGFCLLSVSTSSAGTTTAYYTENIPQIDGTTKEAIEPFVFTLSGASKIKFTPMWGQSPEDQQGKLVQHNGTLSLSVAAKTSPATKEKEETKETETTAPTESATPTTDEKQSSEPAESATQTESKETSAQAESAAP